MNNYFAVTLTLLSTVLTACANQPQAVNYYLLNSPELSEHTEKPTQQVVGLRALRLADYLHDQRIVMQLSDNSLQFSSRHFWAEPLHSDIEKTLLNALNNLAGDTLYLSHTSPQKKVAKRLTLDIDHFLIGREAEVILAGAYQLDDLQGHKRHHRFSIRIALQEDGYQHAVKQLANAIRQLAREIHSASAI